MKSAYRNVFAVIAVAGVMTLGAGCKKDAPAPAASSTNPPSATKPSSPSANPPVISFGTDNLPNVTVNQELTNILANFRNAKSFRAKFSVPSSKGTVSTVLEYLKPSRFRGTMSLGDVQTEIVVIDTNVYMKTNGTKWMDLSGSDMGKPVSDTLKNAMGGDNSLDKLIVDPNTVVKKEQDTARNCMQYSAVVTSPKGSPASLNICAVDNLPKYVDVTTDTGKITFEYYDFNSLFLIEKPM